MSNETKYTPWSIMPDKPTPNVTLIGADGKVACFLADGVQESNAAFIVRACNAHDELVSALEMICELSEEIGFDVNWEGTGPDKNTRIYQAAQYALDKVGK